MESIARILVVDDDAEIRRLLGDYLRANGFSATTVGSGAEARRAHCAAHFDLIVLDLMLPGESGLEICRSLRLNDNVPIIMLTALGDETNRVVGLEVGADDYLPKPFSPRELLGRIRAVLRRTMATSQERPNQEFHKYIFAQWSLDTLAKALVQDDGERIQLTAADCRVLHLLLAGSGQTVSREQLFKELHGRAFNPFDRSIDVRVSRLRHMLGDDARAPDIIKTVHGKGYAIGVDVTAE